MRFSVPRSTPVKVKLRLRRETNAKKNGAVLAVIRAGVVLALAYGIPLATLCLISSSNPATHPTEYFSHRDE
uniref:Uncharacterized protein n=1 Tax=Kalanchoe fedtschenkoi TaxID=63787 RepID=A0A7N0UR86_KALFE